MLTEHEAAEQNQIGYWNHNSYPVHFTSSKAGGGRYEVQAGTAVFKTDGKLVPWHPDLEVQVEAKMLSRITPGSTKYKEFIRQEKGKEKQKVVGTVKATAPVSQTLAQDGPLSDGSLPEGTEILPNGSLKYAGKVFGSRSALEAFMDQQS